jgi:citrate lyase subunit alpha/citrate CoA-transferase
MILAPARRKQNIIVRDRVTTLVAPGEAVDVWVSDRGIAINPKREDLIERMKGSSLTVRKIEEIQEEIKKELPDSGTDIPEQSDKAVGVVMWEDETVIDTLWEVPEK